MSGNVTSVGRRACSAWLAAWLLHPVPSLAALPPGVAGRAVRIQLDGGALHTIPGDERADATVEEDRSAAAEALITATPRGRAVPIIYVVTGLISVPVIWDTIREMLLRPYYGGVMIDGRQMPALITHDRTLPAETILFIGADGKKERYEARTFPEGLLMKLTEAP